MKLCFAVKIAETRTNGKKFFHFSQISSLAGSEKITDNSLQITTWATVDSFRLKGIFAAFKQEKAEKSFGIFRLHNRLHLLCFLSHT
jgi:hypothetical protein